MIEEDESYRKLLENYGATSLRDLDLDAFADGVVAHRAGLAFHMNPYGVERTGRRLSWSYGWNERALRDA